MTRFRRVVLLIVTPLLRCEDWLREWVGYDGGRRRASVQELTEAMRLVSKRHEGWEHGFGPCVCEGHKKARELLAKLGGKP